MDEPNPYEPPSPAAPPLPRPRNRGRTLFLQATGLMVAAIIVFEVSRRLPVALQFLLDIVGAGLLIWAMVLMVRGIAAQSAKK